MDNVKKKILLGLFAAFVQLTAIAQSNTAAANAELNKGIMTSEGKIYVVMAIVITILAGLIIYITRLDRKISKLEKGENL